ncbi:MAG: hypothetical protein AB8B64_20800 [Granulosicoccus sp.]
MIWICTLFLLVVSAWLFFNALNERRWVQAHSHDETVAADKGLFPAFSTRTGSGTLPTHGKVSIDQESSFFARAVTGIQSKTAGFGESFLDAKAAAARIENPENRPRSAGEENTLFGRAVARIGEKAERMDQKLDVKMKEASSQSSSSAGYEDPQVRASRMISATSEGIVDRMKNRTKGITENNVPPATGDRLFDKVLGRVSGGMEKFEAQVELKVAAIRKSAGDSDEDLVTRVASKVGNRISEMDGKIATAARKAASKLDKT